jgi:predicted phage-related endonuclease
MTVTARRVVNRDEWLSWRRGIVTSSKISQLPAFDCSPYREATPLRLFCELRGVEFPTRDDDRTLRRGRWLEPAVAAAVSELRPEWKIRKAQEFFVDGDIGGTPDFFIDNDERGVGVLEAKTISPSVYQRHWDNGKEVPFAFVLQALTCAMLTDAAFAYVGALVVDAHNMDLSLHEIPRHAEAEKKIRDEVARFMADTRAGIEPPVDFQRDGAMLRLLLPRETPGKSIDLGGDNQLPSLLAHRAELIAEMKAMKAECESIENRLRFVMKDADVADGLTGWHITFKTSHFKGYEVRPHDSRVLRILDRRPPDERPGGDDDDE